MEPAKSNHSKEITAIETLTQNYWFRAVQLGSKGYATGDTSDLANRVLDSGYNAEHHNAAMADDPADRDPGELEVQAAFDKVFADVRAEVEAAEQQQAAGAGPTPAEHDRGVT